MATSTLEGSDMSGTAKELGHLLLEEGLVSQSQVDLALEEQVGTRERLGEILRRHGHVSSTDVVDALSKQLGHPRFDPSRDAVEPQALELVPIEFARRHQVLPVRVDPQSLWVAMADPMNVEALDHLRRLASRDDRDVRILLSTEEVLDSNRENYYGSIATSRNVSQAITSVVDELGDLAVADEADDEEAQRHAQDAGIVKLVDQVLLQALRERATDIHIEPQERGLVIRYRVDGMLYDAVMPPRAVFTGVVSRIKILSDLDIAERRAMQDGRFTHRNAGTEVDVRVSVIPTIHGEKLVLRLLDKTNFNFSLRDIGFSQADHDAFIEAIHHPHGMVLLSGPTGSGKTTTLYASLLELRGREVNITTVEDPVEYQIARINQVQVQPKKNVTFATALRSFLRQDPDVIMVGEIRDTDTADIAVRAALTGHMVFSTIHANDAPSTATRLVSMGAEPFMTASALTLVAAQRLVRRTCAHCLESYTPRDEVVLAMGGADAVSDVTFRRGAGCVSCKGRGYHGRVAIVERMMMTPRLRQLVAENRPADEIRAVALESGLVTLRQSGLDKVREGITTVEEVLRVCLSDA